MKKIKLNQILSGLGKQCLLILLALLLSSLFVFISGYNPWIVFKAIGIGLFSDLDGTIRWTIPYILVGIAAAITFRTNIFNMGIDGQFYIGAIAATYISFSLGNCTSVVAIIVTILFAAVSGAAFAVIPALLKTKLNCDEVVTTLLLNYVAYYFTDYVVLGPMLGSGSMVAAQSTNYIPKNSWLPKLGFFSGGQASTGLYFAIVTVFLIAYVVYRTKLGYEVKICAENPNMAQYGGISYAKTIFKVMVISGFIAGLTGAIEIIGVQHRFPIRFSNQLGNDGVVISLLANNNPMGVLLSAFFFGALKDGTLNMQVIADVPSSLVDVVRGIIIFTISANYGFTFLKKFRIKSKTMKKEDA